jgi:hypothetical protein
MKPFRDMTIPELDEALDLSSGRRLLARLRGDVVAKAFEASAMGMILDELDARIKARKPEPAFRVIQGSKL